MKTQPTLFALPAPDKTRSTAAQLTAFCELHGILTHYSKHCRPDHYMALLPLEQDKGKNIGEIMAESCSQYCEDEVGNCATRSSRLSAVRALCKLQNIPCDL